MAKRTWQAIGIGVAGFALLAIQVTALWVAAPYARTLLSSMKAGKVLQAGQSVARMVTQSSGEVARVRVIAVPKSRPAPADASAEAPTPEISATAWDDAELPAAAPEEIVSTEAVPAVGRPIVTPGFEQSRCAQPCPTSSAKASKGAVAKGRTVTTGEWSDATDDGASQAANAKDDRARERESRHESGIGPIKPTTLGSVW